MAKTALSRERIQSLLDECDALEDEMATWQTPGNEPSDSTSRDVQRRYADWLGRSVAVLDEAQSATFNRLYEGTVFSPGIRKFLSNPLAPSPLYNPAEPNVMFPEWQFPFKAVREALAGQRHVLMQAMSQTSSISHVLDELADYFSRLGDYIATLQRHGKPGIPAPIIENEADLQALVDALLRLQYRDVRAEDAVSQHAGGSSRVDFMLRESGIVVETKMTRPSLKDKDVGAELLIDWGRYPRHPDCKAIFALIYDPKRLLRNPGGIEDDLTGAVEGIPTRAIVVH